MTYDFNVEYGLMASDATITYSLSCKAELNNQVSSHTRRNAKRPLTQRGVSKCTAICPIPTHGDEYIASMTGTNGKDPSLLNYF